MPVQVAMRSAAASAAGIQPFVCVGAVDAALVLLQHSQYLTQPPLLHAFALLEAQCRFVVMSPWGESWA